MLLEELQKLISYPTISSDNEENKNAIEWVKKELEGLPLYFDGMVSNGFPSFIATTQKTKKPKLWLQAHMDVVEGSKKVFEHRLDGDILYGRGTYDMKFAIACYMKLFKDLGKELSKYDIAMILTSDEEIGGENGTLALLKDGYRGEVSILPDGGHNWQIEEAAKAVLHLYVRARGTAAHASRPWEAKNAIDDLVKFLELLRVEFPAEPCGSDLHKHNTISVNKITGGTEMNKIAHKAEAWIDIRIMPDTPFDEIKEMIENHAKKFDRVTTEVLIEIESLKLDKNNHYMESFRESVEKVIAEKPQFCTSHGASDARFLAKYGITPVVIAPKGGGHHSENEWVDVKDLERFYEVLRDFVEKEAKVRQ